MSGIGYSKTAAEPLKLPLILWEFRYRPTSSWHGGQAYHARAGSEEAARDFCRVYGHDYEGGLWVEIEGDS